MKLIALKDFARVGEDLKNLKLTELIHEDHIHKGATFEIGKAPELRALGKSDQLLVAQLVAAGCVGDGTDPKVVKAVQDEIAIDKKREATAAKLNAAADASNLVKQLTELLQKANAQVK